jgi:tetratricopeptide (TPR) repeat protein
MTDKRLRWILFGGLAVVISWVYIYFGAPTASFWDCGELLASSYIMGVPHPPGTPLYVMIGRLFTFLPITKEIAFRINLFTVFCGALSCSFVYLIVMKVLSLWKDFSGKPSHRYIPYIAGVSAALFLAFAFSFMDNSVETEVYTPSAVVALVAIYAVLVWYEKAKAGIADNRLILFILFMIFVSTGLHFTPALILPALLIFGLVVNKDSILQLRLLELVGVFIVVLLFSGFNLVDYSVLFLASPVIALTSIAISKTWFFLALIIIYGSYLYYLHSKRQLDARYAFTGLGLIILAGTVHFYLMIRSKFPIAIDEADPQHWHDFLGVLKREQYEPMKLLPRKTQFLTESDYYGGIPSIGAVQAYFEQLKFYLRYFLWQWRGLVGLVPIGLGIYGIWSHYKREKKTFILIGLCFLLASFGLMTYLNLKYSPSDPRILDPKSLLKFAEVRERDYFFSISYVFYTLFIGLGIGSFLELLLERIKVKKIITIGGAAVFTLLPIFFLFKTAPLVSRRHNWIPVEYGYNMLISCGDRGVLFTNGDNDTFPLWFVQATPSKVNGYSAPFKKNVIIANLSLLNTPWYIKQLKSWGVPISFTDREIDDLRPFRTTNRDFLIKDIMMRDIIATAAGIKLNYPKDFAMSTEDFRARVMENYHPETQYPIFYANTVSPDNMQDVEPYKTVQGLVYRIGTKNYPIDIQQTEYLLNKAYKIQSMLDPRVLRDENTQTLLLNYAGTYLGLAAEFQRRGEIDQAESATYEAARFRIGSRYSMPIYFNLSTFALQKGDPLKALAFLDTIEQNGVKNIEVKLRKGIVYQMLSQFDKAEEAYKEAQAFDPRNPRPVERLFNLYLATKHDTTRAAAILEDWLKRSPKDTAAITILKNLEGKSTP